MGGKERKEGWSRVGSGGGCGALKALEDIEWELERGALWRYMQKIYEEYKDCFISGVEHGLASAGDRTAS